MPASASLPAFVGPLSTLRWDDGARTSVEEPILEQARALDRFLASIEKRAFRMARIALRHDDDALDSVQDAMLQLARRYGRRPSEEWRPLFYRILQNRIRDCQRRRRVQARIMAWLPGPEVAGRRRRRRIRGRARPRAAARRSSWRRTRRCRRSSDRWPSCRAGSRRRSCCASSKAWTSRRRRPRWDAAKAASRHTTRGPCIRCASSWELRGERPVETRGPGAQGAGAVRGQRRAAGRAHAIEADPGAQSRAGRGEAGRDAPPLDLGARGRLGVRRDRCRRDRVGRLALRRRHRTPLRSKTSTSSPTPRASRCSRTWSSTRGSRMWRRTGTAVER